MLILDKVPGVLNDEMLDSFLGENQFKMSVHKENYAKKLCFLLQWSYDIGRIMIGK